MSKILVGRDNPKEVEIGVTLQTVAQPVEEDAEEKEELAPAPVKDEQVDAPEERGIVPVEEKAPSIKGRGKKRTKA